jgi:hypothetical protein
VRRGWLYAYEGYFNSPLKNKKTDYHCPWIFPDLGFHINHCVKCVFVVLALMRVSSSLFMLCYMLYYMLCFASTSQQYGHKG